MIDDIEQRFEIMLDDNERGAEALIDLFHLQKHFLHQLRRKAERRLIE